MLGLHVVFGVDRAGLVGEDGETHHGVFDVGFLRHVPGLKLLCPASCLELKDMLSWAVKHADGPVAIRYPRGGNGAYSESRWNGPDSAVVVQAPVGDVAILTYGTMVNQAAEAVSLLAEKGIRAGVVRLLSLGHREIASAAEAVSRCKLVFILEQTMRGCGIREELVWHLHVMGSGCRVDGADLGEKFATHGSIKDLHAHYGLNAQRVADCITEVLGYEN